MMALVHQQGLPCLFSRFCSHGDRRVSSAGSLHPEDGSLTGTTAGMASVAVQFDPERHLSSSPGCGLSTGLQSGSAEFIEWDKRRTRPRFLVALPSAGLVTLRQTFVRRCQTCVAWAA